jgi:thioredoxin:protein disulfide reductase
MNANFFLVLANSNSLLSSVNSWIEQELSVGSFGLSSVFLLFMGGLVASMLPCTYPLYPITAGIIRGRSDDRSRWKHPITYYLGLSFIYFLFGLIAGVTGGAFNTVLRLPETNFIIAGIIFLLALTSVDLLYIPLFNSRSLGEKTKGLSGTFMLGMGAGLLSSPCVGPIVVTILIQLTSGVKDVSIFTMGVAGFKMLLFGLGLGVPFLLVGVFGVKLPKSGQWMKYIQFALGALVLYFSYSFYEKGIALSGISSVASRQILLGFFIVLFSSYILQKEDKLTHEKMKHSLAFLSVVLGILLLSNPILFSNQTVTRTTNLTEPVSKEPKVKIDGNLTWYRDKKEAFAAAKESNRKVFTDFYADWCTNCKEFEKLTLSDTALNEALQKVILLKVIDTDPIFEEYQADERFPELKIGLPFFVITNADDTVIYKTNSYLNTKEMIRAISE